jgi:hypothetical protein
MNKYETWYNQITDNAKNRVLDTYTESHHVIPVSLGGEDTADNLVNLTAREHFICHWLLTKFTTGQDRYKMINALRMMRAENPNQQRYKTQITSRVYENLKTEYSKLQSEKYSGENNPMYGDKFYRSEEGKIKQAQAISGDNNGAKQTQARKKISESKQGKKRDPFSDEWKQKMSEAHKGEKNHRYGVKVAGTKTAKKISEALKGRKQSDELIKKRADAIRGSKREKKLCTHCNQLVAVNGYARWHGDNCRQKG